MIDFSRKTACSTKHNEIRPLQFSLACDSKRYIILCALL